MPNDRKPEIPMLSEAEERALQAQIAADPDAAELTDTQLAALRPAREVLPASLYAALVGQAESAEPTVPVTIHLGHDVVAAFKATGDDWEVRMTATLAREAERLRKAG